MKSLITMLFTAVLMASFNIVLADIQDRHLSGFHNIALSGSFNVFITQGTAESVKVEAPANVINHIITEINGDLLKLRDKNENFSWGNIWRP